METAVFGPGNMIGTVHHPNEFNSIKEIMLAIDFYERLIKKICL
jgi:acetylornithine deacetylase/succinyl-diaminopimelate desuccinylase-like protein